MSVEENIRLADAATKALNDRDMERFESYHLNSVIQRDPQHPDGIKGSKAIRAGVEPMLNAFPDLRGTNEHAFGQGDWVAVRGHLVGTHKAPLQVPGAPSIPPTNKVIRLPFALLAKVEGGKFAEVNIYFDQAGMMAQLGMTPPAPSQSKR
jgi:predicted ester cyclase